MQNVTSSPDAISALPPVMVEVSALTRQRLDELDRLRGIGMARATDLQQAGQALSPSPMLTPEQNFRLRVRNVDAFDRIANHVTLIVAKLRGRPRVG